jgi:hypothetical protein
MRLEFSRQIIEKYLNVKFRKNPSSCCMRTDRETETDGRTEMTKLVIGVRNFAKAPKNGFVCFDKSQSHVESQSNLG